MKEKKEENVCFTPDQQARVQELIDSAYKRAYSKTTGPMMRGEEVERLNEEIERFKEYKKSAMILSVINKHNVVDVKEVAELIAPRLELGENGKLSLRYNQANIDVEEWVENWLAIRPHHLRTNP